MQQLLDVVIEPIKNWFMSLPDFLQAVIIAALVVTGVVVVTLRTFKKVPQGSLGMRTHFGRPILTYPKDLPKHRVLVLKAEDAEAMMRGPVAIHGRPVYRPSGLAKVIPFFNNMDFSNVQRKTYGLNSLVIRLSDGSWYLAYPDAKATFEVVDPYWAHYRHENLQEFLVGRVTTMAGEILTNAADDSRTVASSDLIEQVNERCKDVLHDAGVCLIDLALGSPAPVPETILASAIKTKEVSAEDAKLYGALGMKTDK